MFPFILLVLVACNVCTACPSGGYSISVEVSKDHHLRVTMLFDPLTRLVDVVREVTVTGRTTAYVDVGLQYRCVGRFVKVGPLSLAPTSPYDLAKGLVMAGTSQPYQQLLLSVQVPVVGDLSLRLRGLGSTDPDSSPERLD